MIVSVFGGRAHENLICTHSRKHATVRTWMGTYFVYQLDKIKCDTC